MGNKTFSNRSSNFVSPAALAAELIGGVLAAFFGQKQLSAVLLFVFLLCAAARLWAWASSRRVSVTVTGAAGGLFPGEEVSLDIEVRNNKFLPLIWLELFFPLSDRLCLVPEERRVPDSWEIPALRAQGDSTEMVGEKHFTFFLWYETLRVSSRWRAECRGIYSTAHWSLRTGDGFGLVQTEQPIAPEDVRQFAVYPKLIPVSPELFLRSIWNTESGRFGTMEDPTLIRSTRSYQASDPLRHINWRQLAKGLPMEVNVYQKIMPRGVHFLLDGESFTGHSEELEEALSILASELTVLEERELHCGLSVCRGEGCPAANFFASACSVEELLCALAAYRPLPPKTDTDTGKPIRQNAAFDAVPLMETASSLGHFYYIAYDADALLRQPLLRRLERTCLTLLPYREDVPGGEWESVPLRRLKEVASHGYP